LNSFFADYTKNISKGGTFIHTNKPLDVGTEFKFVLNMPPSAVEGAEMKLELTGVVKWVVAEADATEESPAGMGIQFVFADDAQRKALARFVTDLMHETLGPALAAKLLGK
jgi:type IV pilus assembly protein PilZ